MGLLDGGGARLFGEVLAPLFIPATLRAETTATDNRGDVTRSYDDSPCRVQIDGATETMRRDPDYTDTDRAVIILDASLATGVTPAPGYRVTVNSGPYAGSQWTLAAPADRDPAGAGWRFRGVLGRAV